MTYERNLNFVHRGSASNYVCPTFSRINPKRGLGFILAALERNPKATRREVYATSPHYADRYTEGYHSAIWAWALEGGLIKSVDGDVWVCLPDNCWHWKKDRLAKRAIGHSENGKYVVRYELTNLGRNLTHSMRRRGFNF